MERLIEVPVANDESRVVCLDNLRWLLVCLVIVEHASHAYSGNVTWWPVIDPHGSSLAGWLSAISDATAMPLLFFIAGYFAIPSITKRGTRAFVSGKLRRLGIPWLVCILFICPVLPLIHRYTRNGLSLDSSYWEIWRELMQNFARFDVGLITSMNTLMQQNLFYQRYMWFLSLLLLFFLLFALLYAVRPNWFLRIEPPIPQRRAGVFRALKYLLAVGALTSVCSFAVTGAILTLGPDPSNPEPLLTLGNIIQFRPSRLFFFIIYFGLGLAAFRRHWMERGGFPDHLKTWIIAWIGLLGTYLFLRQQMRHGPESLEEVYGMLFFLSLNFLTMASLGCGIAIGTRYWNRFTPLSRNLALNAYDMYLSHYPIVLALQLGLLMLPGVPGLLRFGLASVLAVTGAFGVSHLLLRPFPRLSVAAAGALFIAMAAWVRP